LQTGGSEGDGLAKTINLQIFKPLALHCVFNPLLNC